MNTATLEPSLIVPRRRDFARRTHLEVTFFGAASAAETVMIVRDFKRSELATTASSSGRNEPGLRFAARFP